RYEFINILFLLAMYAQLTSITEQLEDRFQTEGPKITFKAHAFKFRMTSDINSKVIGQPGQETDEIGKLSLRRELETHRNLIVRPEITTETCKSQRGVYLEALSEDWTYKPL